MATSPLFFSIMLEELAGTVRQEKGYKQEIKKSKYSYLQTALYIKCPKNSIRKFLEITKNNSVRY